MVSMSTTCVLCHHPYRRGCIGGLGCANFSSEHRRVDVIAEQVRADYGFSSPTLSLSRSVVCFHIASPSVTPRHFSLLTFFSSPYRVIVVALLHLMSLHHVASKTSRREPF